MAALTASLARLRADFNTRFPNRDKASDGWIGDARHQAETSGHNPDDTTGSKSEYSDADGKPEVRAVDVDDDLRTAGATMQAVIDQMLRTPNDLKRLRYIIYNRRIWSRNTSWQPRAYTGASDHTEHAHFSGDPAYDEDTSPWSVAIRTSSAPQWKDGTMLLAQGPDGKIYLCDGFKSREIPATKVADLRNVAGQGLLTLGSGDAKNTAEWTWEGQIRKGWDPVLYGPVDGDLVESEVLEAEPFDLDALANKVATRLGALRFEATNGS